jgi:hypothetical protein
MSAPSGAYSAILACVVVRQSLKIWHDPPHCSVKFVAMMTFPCESTTPESAKSEADAESQENRE